MRAAVLPPSVFGPGPLKWIYLTMAVLMIGGDGGHLRAAVRPAVGTSDSGGGRILGRGAGSRLDGQRDRQRIAGTTRRAIGRVIAIAPLVVASGLALGAVTQRDDASAGIVVLWALALLVAGIGIGMAWPHLVGARNGFRQRPGRKRRGGRGDQHRATDLRGIRRRVGRCRGQHGPEAAT